MKLRWLRRAWTVALLLMLLMMLMLVLLLLFSLCALVTQDITHIPVHARSHTFTHIHTHSHTYTHTHIHTHSHTYTHIRKHSHTNTRIHVCAFMRSRRARTKHHSPAATAHDDYVALPCSVPAERRVSCLPLRC